MNDLRKNLSFRAANIRHYFPDILANAKEFISWADVVEPELNVVIYELLQNCLNTFVYDVDESGLERYESMLGIIPKVDASFEDRRNEVLLMINNQILYTHRSLQGIFNSRYGKNKISISLNYGKYELWLDLVYNLVFASNQIRTYMRSIIPANLTVNLSNTKEAGGKIFAGGICKLNSVVHITPNLEFTVPEIGQHIRAAGYIRTAHKVIEIKGGLING